jgi:hypothetical protein
MFKIYQPLVEIIPKTCQPVILPACQPSVSLFVFESLSEQGLTQVTHMYMFKMYQPLALWRQFKKPASLSSCQPSVGIFVFESLSEQGITQVTRMYMFKMYQPLALWRQFKKPASL